MRLDGYEQLIDGEPITMMSNESFSFKCCDCGLIHNVVIATEEIQEIGLAVERVQLPRVLDDVPLEHLEDLYTALGKELQKRILDGNTTA